MSNHDTKVLNTLIVTTIDSAKGYEDAAERASDDRLKPIFDHFARERRQTADRLKDQVRQIGGTPEDSGTLKAAAHRRWLDLKDALGRGDGAVLDSVEAGEAYIREKYEAALNDDTLSPVARDTAAEAYRSVASGKAQVSELRRRCGLAEEHGGSGRSWSKLALGLGAVAAAAGIAVATSKRRASQERDDEHQAFTMRLETDENVRLISSKKVEGTPVFGRDGTRLGTIDSFMVDKYSGRVGYAVMTFGGTLGFGASLFPLPWPVLTYHEDEGGYVIDLTKDELANAPRFEPNDEPEFDLAYRRRIIVFYRPRDGAEFGGPGGDRRAAGTSVHSQD